MRKKAIIFFFLIFFFFSFQKTEAVVLFFQPKEGKFLKNDVFLVEVKMDTEKETVNAVQLKINFPPQLLEVVNISDGGSVFHLWPEKPRFSNEKGEINFVAGIPGGFNGQGKIVSIAFRAIFSDEVPIFGQVYFNENSKVFLNDGQGTEAKTTLLPAFFEISPRESTVIKDQWQEKLYQDKNPPQPFNIEILRDPLIFDGRYFLYFQTIDLESGIDRYEIKEGRGDWKVVEPPYYLVDDQNLKTKIIVKAIDKAGNERMAEFVPYLPFYKKPSFILLIVLLILILIFILKFILKSKPSSKKSSLDKAS